MQSLYDWFDPSLITHLRALRYADEHGHFPEDFIVNGVEVGPTDIIGIYAKVAQAHLTEKLGPRK